MKKLLQAFLLFLAWAVFLSVAYKLESHHQEKISSSGGGCH